MALMPSDSMPYFENAIYLPMLIQILEADRQLVEVGPFKLKRPYMHLIDEALKIVRAELKETNAYLRKNKMKLVRSKPEELFTSITCFHGGYEDPRRYLNVRLKNRSEELIGMYFDIVKLQK